MRTKNALKKKMERSCRGSVRLKWALEVFGGGLASSDRGAALFFLGGTGRLFNDRAGSGISSRLQRRFSSIWARGRPGAFLESLVAWLTHFHG